MKAIIEVDIPDFQIGQEVSIYFKDTMMIKGVVQEPCSDAISRQAVNEIINDIRDCISVEGYWAIIERMKKLPPVNPQPKTGHWIYDDECKEHGHCDICGFKTDLVDGNPHNYCPNCGARMESEL